MNSKAQTQKVIRREARVVNFGQLAKADLAAKSPSTAEVNRSRERSRASLAITRNMSRQSRSSSRVNEQLADKPEPSQIDLSNVSLKKCGYDGSDLLEDDEGPSTRRRTRQQASRRPTEKYREFQKSMQGASDKKETRAPVKASESSNAASRRMNKLQMKTRAAADEVKAQEPLASRLHRSAKQLPPHIDVCNTQMTMNSTPGKDYVQQGEVKSPNLTRKVNAQAAKAVVGIAPHSLKPKRIMSKTRTPTNVKKEEMSPIDQLNDDKSPADFSRQTTIIEHIMAQEEIDEKIPAPKGKKDRSQLIGLKRTRKSRDQIYELQRVYEDSKGKPTKEQLADLARGTGLKLQQVYKWYWDMEKKNDRLQKELQANTDHEIKSPARMSRKIMKTQYTDEFGGYSKTWFADGLRQCENPEGVDDSPPDADGADFGMDCLARSLGLDINAIALRLAMQSDSMPPVQTHIFENSVPKRDSIAKSPTHLPQQHDDIQLKDRKSSIMKIQHANDDKQEQINDPKEFLSLEPQSSTRRSKRLEGVRLEIRDADDTIMQDECPSKSLQCQPSVGGIFQDKASPYSSLRRGVKLVDEVVSTVQPINHLEDDKASLSAFQRGHNVFQSMIRKDTPKSPSLKLKAQKSVESNNLVGQMTPKKSDNHSHTSKNNDMQTAFDRLFRKDDNNLFSLNGGGLGTFGKKSSPNQGIHTTPSFLERRQSTKSGLLNASKLTMAAAAQKAFTLMPCSKPSKDFSMVGFKANQNGANQNSQETKEVDSPMNTEKILRPVVKEQQMTKKITPSQFIMTAAPQPDKTDKSESQQGNRMLNLFTNPVATSALPNGTLRRQTPKPFKLLQTPAAQNIKLPIKRGSPFAEIYRADIRNDRTSPSPLANLISASPSRNQPSIINIYQQPIITSTKNFYQSSSPSGGKVSSASRLGHCELCNRCDKCPKCDSCQGRPSKGSECHHVHANESDVDGDVLDDN